uniref:Candidate secreted effector n=1 Tax=Meloidogyne incognita TaxID=6306 RepID=A0A914KHH8_MELIC
MPLISLGICGLTEIIVDCVLLEVVETEIAVEIGEAILVEFVDEIEVAGGVLFEFVDGIVVAGGALLELLVGVVVTGAEPFEFVDEIVVAGGVLVELVSEIVVAGSELFELLVGVVVVVAELFEFVDGIVVAEVLFEFVIEIVVVGVLFEFVGEVVAAIVVLFEFAGEIVVAIVVLFEFVGEIVFPDILVEVDEFVTGITFPAAVLLELITVAGMLVVLLTGVLLEFIDEVVAGRAVIGRGVVTLAALLELAEETVDNTVANVLFELVEEFVTGISAVVGTCIIPQMFEKLLEINGTPIAIVVVVVSKIAVEIVGSVLLVFVEFVRELAVVAAILL